MPLSGGEISNYIRLLINDSDNQGRFSDADVLSASTQGCRAISLAARFPEYQITTTSIADRQEYTLPEVVNIKRVYVAGQRIPQTSIAALEGAQLRVFDQSGTGQVPLWKTAASAAYPVTADCGFPAPSPDLYYIGQRPEFYQRGESTIGLVPPPANAVTITVEGIAFPPQIQALSDKTIYPRQYLEAIAWYAASRLLFADSDMTRSQIAMGSYEGAKRELMDWLSTFSDSKQIIPITYRSTFGQRGY